MALPALVSGADCGPLNPLQSLSKQFDKDRSVQQDHFGPGRAGPSRETFRSQSAHVPAVDEDAARFFSEQASSAAFAHVMPNSFDFSALRTSLPQLPQQPRLVQPPSLWAGDFLNQSTMRTSHHPHTESTTTPHQSMSLDPPGLQHGPYMLPLNNGFMNGVFMPPMQAAPVIHHSIPAELPKSAHVTNHATRFDQVEFPQEIQQQESRSEPIDSDELSWTAGLLVEAVKEEANPKFQKSAFLGLMRQLRDKEMTIEGADVVKTVASSRGGATDPSTWASDFTALPDVKGKGKGRGEDGLEDENIIRTQLVTPETSQVAQPWQDNNQLYSEFATEDVSKVASTRKSVHFGRHEVLEEYPGTKEVETTDDRYWRQENIEYQDYWKSHRFGTTARDDPEWGRLQDDWDRFEATSTGIRPISVYRFQPNNPYLIGDSSTHNHLIHTQRISANESVLEKEAFVQNNMGNPVAWFDLGVKQQENEREADAIQALRRAVELDPSYLEAWLALAISYTNESDKNGAYDAIEHWVRNNERYKDKRPLDSLDREMASERHEQLVECLMGLARAVPEVDADIQTALGVMLNTCEDYAKAQDCFQTALAVRPNDWLLYNRVGATLANSGQSDEALRYYYRALELNPSYIRARFNLGISCINMKRFDEAAEHILDALVLQENDASSGGETRGITSSALWECLRTTCLHLQRPELAHLCDSRDLEGFRKAFWT